MKANEAAILVLAATLVLAACRHQARGSPALAQSLGSATCGRLRAWHIPSPLEEQPGAQRAWTTLSRLTMVALAAEEFCSARGAYPRSLPELAAFADTLKPHRDLCRLDRHLLVDEWGTSIRYVAAGAATPTVLSAGPDRVFGTADDLTLPLADDSAGFAISAPRDCGQSRLHQ